MKNSFISLLFLNQLSDYATALLREIVEKPHDMLKFLKFFLEAGVTPDWAEDPKDEEALKGK